MVSGVSRRSNDNQDNHDLNGSKNLISEPAEGNRGTSEKLLSPTPKGDSNMTFKTILSHQAGNFTPNDKRNNLVDSDIDKTPISYDDDDGNFDHARRYRAHSWSHTYYDANSSVTTNSPYMHYGRNDDNFSPHTPHSIASYSTNVPNSVSPSSPLRAFAKSMSYLRRGIEKTDYQPPLNTYISKDIP